MNYLIWILNFFLFNFFQEEGMSKSFYIKQSFEKENVYIKGSLALYLGPKTSSYSSEKIYLMKTVWLDWHIWNVSTVLADFSLTDLWIYKLILTNDYHWYYSTVYNLAPLRWVFGRHLEVGIIANN